MWQYLTAYDDFSKQHSCGYELNELDVARKHSKCLKTKHSNFCLFSGEKDNAGLVHLVLFKSKITQLLSFMENEPKTTNLNRVHKSYISIDDWCDKEQDNFTSLISHEKSAMSFDADNVETNVIKLSTSVARQ